MSIINKILKLFFKIRDNRESKITNFNLLQRTFVNINVPFDSNKSQEIMAGKRGCASKLLYQIRSTLEKKGMNLENLSLKKCKKIKNKKNFFLMITI